MDDVNTWVSIVMILLGGLTAALPDLFAGYSDLSDEEEEIVKKLNIPGMFSKGLVIIGVLSLVTYHTLLWLEYSSLAEHAVPTIIVFGSLALVLKAGMKYKSHQK